MPNAIEALVTPEGILGFLQVVIDSRFLSSWSVAQWMRSMPVDKLTD